MNSDILSNGVATVLVCVFTVHWQLILAEASNNLIYFHKRIWFDFLFVARAFLIRTYRIHRSLFNVILQRQPQQTAIVWLKYFRFDVTVPEGSGIHNICDDEKQHFHRMSCFAFIDIVYICVYNVYSVNLPRWDSTFLLLQQLWCKRCYSRLEASTFAVYCTVDYT